MSGVFPADTIAMTTFLTLRSLGLSFRRRLCRETGQSLVEFAVVLPIFILLILGILYFSRYENYANQETQLAEQGARWAAVNFNSGYPPSLQTYIQSQASPELASGSGDVTKLQVYIYYSPFNAASPATPTGTVRVCVTSTASFPSPVGTSTYPITESASMHVEQTPSTWMPDTPPSQCPSN